MTRNEFTNYIVSRLGYVNVDYTIYVRQVTKRIIVTDTVAISQLQGFGIWADREVYFYDDWFINEDGLLENKDD